MPWLNPLFLLVTIASWAGSVHAETLHLRNGGLIKGEILSRRADRVVIDLGFTVLTVPSGEIERIESEDLESKAITTRLDDLYRVDATLPKLTVRENVARCGGAVVEIRTPSGIGSGFIIHKSGYIVTNDHVIAGEHEITVTLFKAGTAELEKKQLKHVRIVATPPHLDLALLKIESDDPIEFKTAPLGDSDGLKQGQTVFLIGSPLGFERTVSEGIVSLRNRPSGGQLYIQTTTQINPGNSGGPLFNLRGEVVGVANMKLSGLGVEGMGFAIPVHSLKTFLKNRDAFAFDPRNVNTGFRYMRPPRPRPDSSTEGE